MTEHAEQQTNPTNDTDKAAVRSALAGHYRAWAAGDADAFVANYTEDATVCMPGVFNAGRSAIRDHLAAGFAGPLRGSTGIDNPISIRVVGDCAIVVSRAGVLMAGEQSVPPEREVLATWLLVRGGAGGRGGAGWLVASYHNCPAQR